MKSLRDQSLGVRPFKDLVRLAVRDSGLSGEEIAAALGFSKAEHVGMYLDGTLKVSFQRVTIFAEAIALDPLFGVRCWMKECFPELLEFLDLQPAPLLLTMNERRCINHIREFNEGSDAELIVADGRDVLAVVMT